MISSHGMSVDRRVLIGLIAAAVPGAALAGGRAKLSVREVVTILRDAHDRPPDLSHRDLAGLNLADLDFKRADLSHTNLFGADLTAANLEGCNLTDAVLDRTILVRARLTGAKLRNASIRRPSVSSDLGFDAKDLPVFRNADMAGVRLTARLDGADFGGADLSNASFSIWQERGLGGAPTTGLARCNFSAAKMQKAVMRGLSLAHASFRDADLSDADLRDTDLTGADLTGARLDGTLLTGATLEGVLGRVRP